MCVYSTTKICANSTSLSLLYLCSAILYLNDDIRGGDFFFARSLSDLSPDVLVQPKCGRLVGFSAGKENLHGVLPVIEGRRCAIALWFTLDPTHKELSFDSAWEILSGD